LTIWKVTLLSILESEAFAMPTMPDTQSREALEVLKAANRAMADRSEPAPWHHLAVGLLVGATAAVQDTPLAWGRIYLVVCAIGLFLLARAYRERTGLRLGSFRPGRTLWVMLVWAVGVVAMFAAARWAAAGGLGGAYLAAGALIAAATTAAGYVWHWAYRRDLGVI
jgi:hypothetical protein